jgi:AraC-like DNA-binding protein
VHNFYDDLLQHPDAPGVTRLSIGEFLFVQYSCLASARVPLWAHADYLISVISGKKTWHTADGVWEADPGETLFFKKGAIIAEQHYEPDFCLLIFFIPDDLVRTTVRELAASLDGLPPETPPMKTVVRVQSDTALAAFIQSIRAYISAAETPSEPLLRVKVKELIVSILVSGKNPTLSAYFRRLAESDVPSLPEIMEANYRFNLSLEEYARLCHRSLSSFKRDFRAAFNEAPGRWLLRKRLEYSAALLRNSKMNVTEVAFESGFEDVSHFSRVFKERFQVAPLGYRQADPVVS